MCDEQQPPHLEAPPHAVLLPYPIQGHINPMAQLAKALARHGVRVTLVHTRRNHARIAANQAATRVPLIHHTWIEDGVAPDFDYTDLVPRFMEFHVGTLQMEEPFRQLLRSLARDQSSRATCVVFGSFCGWAHSVATELGIPAAFFWTQSASVLDIYYHQSLLQAHGFFPYSQFTPDTTATGNGTSAPGPPMVDYIPGIPPVRPSDIPTLMHVNDTDDPRYQNIKEQVGSLTTCRYVLLNTFYELEREACDVLRHVLPKSSSVHLLGPLVPSAFLGCDEGEDASVGASLLEETNECIAWLDKQRTGSVLYVSFGSLVHPSLEDYEAIACGVKASKQPFLWVIKPMSSVHGVSDLLPPNFQEETKHVGLIVPWAPQLDVLSHPSVGAFLSHCGWNSTLESLSMGVPILPFPNFSDQPTNSRYVTEVWRAGLAFERGASGKVSSAEVARVVARALCEEEGKAAKERALRFKEGARKATRTNGSSHADLQRFIESLECAS